MHKISDFFHDPNFFPNLCIFMSSKESHNLCILLKFNIIRIFVQQYCLNQVSSIRVLIKSGFVESVPSYLHKLEFHVFFLELDADFVDIKIVLVYSVYWLISSTLTSLIFTFRLIGWLNKIWLVSYIENVFLHRLTLIYLFISRLLKRQSIFFYKTEFIWICHHCSNKIENLQKRCNTTTNFSSSIFFFV